MKIFAHVLVGLTASAWMGWGGGGSELQDYDPSATAVGLLAEYVRVRGDIMETHSDRSRVLDDGSMWLDLSEGLAEDRPALYYMRARIEYDTYNRLGGAEDARNAVHLDRALEHIKLFVDSGVAYADGHALHGAILGQKIAANPVDAMRYAGSAKRASETALHLDPDNQLAHISLGFSYANAPRMFGGDLDSAVKHFREAFANGNVSMRAFAGVWLSITYEQIGESARAVEIIQEVLELVPGYSQAEATARAFEDGADPVVYLERLESGRVDSMRSDQ